MTGMASPRVWFTLLAFAALALTPRYRRALRQTRAQAPEPELRRNRLALLARLRAAMDSVADLSKIDG